MKTYGIRLSVTSRDTFLSVDYDETEFARDNHDKMRSAIELLVMQVAAPKTQGIKYEYIDDSNNEVTIYCKIDHEKSLSEVGKVVELIEQQLIENQ